MPSLISIIIFLMLLSNAFGDEISTMPNDWLGEQYRQLRVNKGHFAGAAWDHDIDAWNGRKHRIMLLLVERLAQSPTAELLALLGNPDLIVDKNDKTWYQRLLLASNYANHNLVFWIYYWREQRDFLYFVIDDESTIQARWWHAYE